MNKLNYYTLLMFAPVLILTGITGFILPETHLSVAPAYNVFHIIFGFLGLGCVLSKKPFLIRCFNISFGLIDLYQAAASFFNIFPEEHFRWRAGDDVLHVGIGLGLVLIGVFGRK